MKDAALKPAMATAQHTARIGVLLPLPLEGPYDYVLRGTSALPRGTLVTAPLGPRTILGAVWSDGDGALEEKRLKAAEPLDGAPALPPALCDFIDWVARYTLSPPGQVLALALRVRNAFEPEIPRIAYARGAAMPARLTPGRERVLAIAGDGLARSVPGLAAEADVSPAVVRGLIDAGALAETELPEFNPHACPDPDCDIPTLSGEQQAAADILRADVAAHAFFRFAARRGDGLRQDRNLFRSRRRSRAPGQADAHTVAGDRANGAIPRPLCRALRLPPRRVAQRSVAERAQTRLSRGDERRGVRCGGRALFPLSSVQGARPHRRR